MARVRRAVAIAALAAVLLSAASASAGLQPVRYRQGEVTVPRVRAGTISIPSGHARGRVTVIVTLSSQPLAAWSRSLASRAARTRLSTRSAASRAYLAQLARRQDAAVFALRRAIPEATVSRRFRVLLDGLTVTLPAKRLPALVTLSLAQRVYPSLRYSLALDRSPSLVGVHELVARTGALGDGVKIAVVDDGIDTSSTFFSPAGFSYPAGFPKGGAKFTTAKVIVARAFPGPGAGKAGRLPLDRKASFHGTHVAGIAAGVAGTTAPASPSHPRAEGLSGVAPRAWLGNYRVFNVPTPIGNVANTPEIIAAFEAAVVDGMDVINFSGGGPQVEPANDAMIETIRNVAAAGVVPVIAAGNDRDDYGFGSAGSPGTAPDAISVAAVSNTHVFSPTLTVTSPGAPATVTAIPFVPAPARPPTAWARTGTTIADVSSVLGSDTNPVDPYLCGARDPNSGRSTLPAHSLDGTVALVLRGRCTFVSKALRAKAAGAIGLVVVDNRAGEANGIPVELALRGGMIGDLDGSRLRAYLAGTGGHATVRLGGSPQELETGRGGTITSFSSAGLTAYGHKLKPDLAAPGGQILSATLKASGGPFAVFDGTSMAAPHVAGLAALLVERHPWWSARQVKSALVSTAGPAWSDTARTIEAPVPLQGGGLANVDAADDPRLFTDPVSLSFGDLDVNPGAARTPLLLAVADAGGGAGTWTVEIRPQSQPAGSSIEVPSTLALAAGAEAFLPVVARASIQAETGDAYGFLVLRNGPSERRVPYAFLVTRPGLAGAPVKPLRFIQTGDTRQGSSRAQAYRYPAAPFGPPPDYAGPTVVEPGAETLYSIVVSDPVANFGAAVIAGSGLVHPWVLGSKDENDVQGYAATPVNVNNLTPHFPLDIGAAAAVFPTAKTYFIAVDSGRDPFTGRSLAGSYVLRSWMNDVTPPLVGLVTGRVSAGRPTIAIRALDAGAGIDPYSFVLSYGGALVGAAAYDPASGVAIFPLPKEAPKLKAGKRRLTVGASDFQEAKNVDSIGDSIMPNTTYASGTIRVVARPTVTWLAPEPRECLTARAPLTVIASATRKIRSVRFLDGRRTIATTKRGPDGIYQATWRTRGVALGPHRLRAIVTDTADRKAEARLDVRLCRR